MNDLASSYDAVINDVDGRIGYKTWCKYECYTPIETTQNVSVAQKLLRLVSQDFMVRRVCTFLDQIDILCYDILCDKTSLV